MKKGHKKSRIHYGRFLVLIIVIVASFIVVDKFFLKSVDSKKETSLIMSKFVGKDEDYLDKFKKISFDRVYKYDDDFPKGKVISQSVPEGTEYKAGTNVSVVISLGKVDKQKFTEDGINELGRVPIMMYHGIEDVSDNKYVGGNIDRDGYNRTADAFRKDLEFYYSKGYRMVRLVDYVNGKIDVSYGKSPLVLTFDDGNSNNIRVTGLDSNGDIVIDPNSAVGILEEFKKKYKDFNVTATFFVNDSLFNQPEYDEKILKWLVNNGYDVGNHTKGHTNFTKVDIEKTQEVVADVYKRLDDIIPNRYVKIVALPFGSPYNKNHSNFPYILRGSYDGYSYETESALRVGWEPEVSPFDKDFDKTFLKRCRAYDNNGKDFDIEYVFNMLDNKRYISDGVISTVVAPEGQKNKMGDTKLDVVYY